MQFPITRMRRLRKNSKIRDIVRETKLQKEDLIYPIPVLDIAKSSQSLHSYGCCRQKKKQHIVVLRLL